jgi:hypothetical protein
LGAALEVIGSPILALLLAIADPAPSNQAPASPPVSATAPSEAPPAGAQPPAAAPGEDDDQSTGPLAPVPPPAAQAAPDQTGPVPYSDADAKAYSDAVRAAARAAEALQGPLDGGWTLSDARGRPLYSFRMVDQGQGMGLAQGAWRDLAAGEGPFTSGFVDSVGYDGGKLMLRFYESGPDDLVVLTLTPSSAGVWPGELWRHGAVTKVSFKRDAA